MKRGVHYFWANLPHFSRDNPIQAYQLERVDYSTLKFCQTFKGELNLVEKGGKRPFYLHAQEGAEAEALYWSKILPLGSINALFVYGLGLGYYYLPLKVWLAENPERYLVFLEDDPRVVCRFLETDLASEVLNHPQVMVRLIPRVEPNQEGWERLRAETDSMIGGFALKACHVSALQSYLLNRFAFFHPFSVQWYGNITLQLRKLKDMTLDIKTSDFRPAVNYSYENLYANLPFISESILGYQLAGALRSVPAVICGAGPSLAKQLPLVKKLHDYGLVIASGSAVNALTQAGIIPHLGGAIDPTSAQASRQLTSYAYNMPAFYQIPFYHKAFEQWHGPLIYMTTGGQSRVYNWFEKECGIKEMRSLISAVSTSNFLAEIARFLMCNPIILAGMDLAYTEGDRYAKGVYAHPADERAQHQELHAKEEILLPVPGQLGKDVYTTSHWFFEAVIFAAFKERNPDLRFLNATEGGMAIPTIENVSFSTAIGEYFQEEWDVEGWLHGCMQNASHEKVPSEAIIGSITRWEGSLKRCRDCLDNLIQDLNGNKKRLGRKKKLPFGPYTGLASLWQVELFSEPVYEYFLQTMDVVFETIHSLQIRSLKFITKQIIKQKEEVKIEIERCQFLKQYVEYHMKGVSQGMENFRRVRAALADRVSDFPRLANREFPDYLSKDQLCIEEPSLEISITAPFHPQLIPRSSWPKSGVEALIGMAKEKREGQTLYFYPEGRVKAEAFYREGKLHGPWSFYSEEGKLLARSWFVEGKRQGRSQSYYSNGAVYSLRGYRDGVLHGEQLHYFEDGMLKTLENYDQGKLHGVVQLYYANGRLKKEQHFVQGQLQGKERAWNLFGQLTLEAFYEEGKPIGTSRKWHDNGQIACEIVHGPQGESVKEWDEEGREKNGPR